MDLVRREREAAGEDELIVRISPQVRNNLGVRVAPVIRQPLPRTIDAVGQVVYDESRVRHIHARAEGWARRVHVSSVGDRVEKGQPLVELFSPLLESAQEEFLQALRMGGDALVKASENRLRSLGIGPAEIQRLRNERRVDGYIVFRSEMDGVVTRLDVREGMFVRPDTDMVVMADLARIWIEADVLTRQSGWLEPGLPATVTLDQSDDPLLDGELSYVYPEADPVTRAVRVRLSFANPGGRLKPNSFATVRISERDAPPVLQIPREALIRSSRENRVIIDAGDNRFLPRPVTVAYESGQMAAISAGLEAGEQVVVSGQFMLDSEASLQSELERVGSGGPKASMDGHQH
jgi:Cu(I)/Ag(I) efflux system membrane fusion protein